MKTYLKSSAVLLLTVVALWGCGGTKSSSNNSTNPVSGGTSATPVDNASATIENFAFKPAVIYLKPGGTVTWTNKDATAHTVTDNGGSFDSGNMDVNATYQHTFPSTPGTYTYHCTYHSMMVNAQVVVGN